MTETAPLPREGALVGGDGRPRRGNLDEAFPELRDLPDAPHASGVTFPDLAWAHYWWSMRRKAGASDDGNDKRYRETRAAFEQRFGEIVDEYWSSHDASGVVLTRRPRRSVLRPFRRDDYRFHRATDWVTRESPTIACALDKCDSFALKAGEVLDSTSELLTLQSVQGVAKHLLGCIERTHGVDAADEQRRVARQQLQELRKLEDYYERAGSRIGRIVYTRGMLLGLAVLGVIAAALTGLFWAFGLLDGSDHKLQAFFMAYAAGSLGAFFSVFQRMASEGKFSAQYDLGRRSLLTLGSYRPAIGAVSGVAVYFILESGLLETQPPNSRVALFYYGSLAFVAGFSERFMRVMVRGAEARGPGGKEKEEEEEPEPSAQGRGPRPGREGEGGGA